MAACIGGHPDDQLDSPDSVLGLGVHNATFAQPPNVSAIMFGAQAQRCRAPAGRRARRVSSARRGRHGQHPRRERGPWWGARACVVHPGALAEAQRGRPGSCGGDAIAALAGLSTLHVSGASHHSVSSLPCIAPTRPHPLWCPPRRAPRAPLPVLGPFRAAPLPRRALC